MMGIGFLTPLFEFLGLLAPGYARQRCVQGLEQNDSANYEELSGKRR